MLICVFLSSEIVVPIKVGYVFSEVENYGFEVVD